MGVSLVLDDGLLREAARDGFAVEPVGVEVGGDRFGKLQVGHRSLRRSCGETTMTSCGRLENHI